MRFSKSIMRQKQNLRDRCCETHAKHEASRGRHELLAFFFEHQSRVDNCGLRSPRRFAQSRGVLHQNSRGDKAHRSGLLILKTNKAHVDTHFWWSQNLVPNSCFISKLYIAFDTPAAPKQTGAQVCTVSLFLCSTFAMVVIASLTSACCASLPSSLCSAYTPTGSRT